MSAPVSGCPRPGLTALLPCTHQGRSYAGGRLARLLGMVAESARAVQLSTACPGPWASEMLEASPWEALEQARVAVEAAARDGIQASTIDNRLVEAGMAAFLLWALAPCAALQAARPTDRVLWASTSTDFRGHFVDAAEWLLPVNATQLVRPWPLRSCWPPASGPRQMRGASSNGLGPLESARDGSLAVTRTTRSRQSCALLRPLLQARQVT